MPLGSDQLADPNRITIAGLQLHNVALNWVGYRPMGGIHSLLWGTINMLIRWARVGRTSILLSWDGCDAPGTRRSGKLPPYPHTFDAPGLLYDSVLFLRSCFCCLLYIVARAIIPLLRGP